MQRGTRRRLRAADECRQRKQAEHSDGFTERRSRCDTAGQMQNAVIAGYRLRVLSVLQSASFLAPLLGRLCVGLLFLSTGWGKVHSLDKVTHFFVTLGIP